MHKLIYEGVVLDDSAQMRCLHAYEFDFDHDCNLTPYRLCYTCNGYIFIKGTIIDNNWNRVRTTIGKYDAVKNECTELPGMEIRTNASITFSIIHKERIYIVPWHEPYHISYYDMEEHSWSKVSMPEECREHISSFNGAVVGDDLFCMDDRLHFFRVDKDKLERIHTEIKHQECKGSYQRVSFFSLTAVHHWLYVFTQDHNSDRVQVYCYDTTLGISTTIPVFFHLDPDYFALPHTSSIMFENKIYFVGSITRDVGTTECRLYMLYEYNLLDDTFKRSSRPHPKVTNFQLSVIDVATKLLEPESTIPVYAESLTSENEVAIDAEEESDNDYNSDTE